METENKKDEMQKEGAYEESKADERGKSAGEGEKEEKIHPEGTEQTAGTDPAVEEVKAEPEEAEKAPEAEADEKPAGEKGGKKERGSARHKKELAKKDEEIAGLRDQVMRRMAEFDNYRKRTEREKASRFEDGERYILERLLPVVDNFERGLAGVTEEAKKDPYVAGMEAIYKQFETILADAGVTAIEAVGKPFDPSFHNAVMHVEDENAGENEIVEELQKGYCFKDSVLRYSMVKVAN